MYELGTVSLIRVILVLHVSLANSGIKVLSISQKQDTADQNLETRKGAANILYKGECLVFNTLGFVSSLWDATFRLTVKPLHNTVYLKNKSDY